LVGFGLVVQKVAQKQSELHSIPAPELCLR
jgi:hypothetical protein